MERVKDVLRNKGSDIYEIGPENSVLDALTLMARMNIGAVLVRNEEGELEGIFSERDVARKSVIAGGLNTHAPVRELMSRRVFCINGRQSLDDAMALMTRNKCRHLPVLEEEDLVGIISIGDIVKALIEEKDLLIDQLEHYIAGSI